MKYILKINLDIIGFCLSFLCALHCFLFPILAILFSSYKFFFSDDAIFEFLFFGASILIACISLIYSYNKKHKNFYPLRIAIPGIIFLLVSFILNPELLKISFSITGASLIAIAHYKNWLLCKTICTP